MSIVNARSSSSSLIVEEKQYREYWIAETSTQQQDVQHHSLNHRHWQNWPISIWLRSVHWTFEKKKKNEINDYRVRFRILFTISVPLFNFVCFNVQGICLWPARAAHIAYIRMDDLQYTLNIYQLILAIY